jgi:hypothetical protein
MLTTVFCSATGGALSKKSNKECDVDCDDGGLGECAVMHAGRLLAIALVSSVVAGIPIAILSSLHSREFVRVAYEGSLDWQHQLRRWRRADLAVWVLGLAYCAFAVNYICLFFANVAAGDQSDWMTSAKIGLVEDFIIIPAAVGFAITVVAMVLLACVACRHGVQKEHITKTGSIALVREVFSSHSDKQAIKRALAGLQEHEGNGTIMRSKSMHGRQSLEDGRCCEEVWEKFEVSMAHDVCLADLGNLKPPSA